MIKEIANHRSIRKYKSSPIDEEVLSDILHSAARASTCGNMQLYSLVVTLDARVRAELAPCHFNQAMVTEAPCVVTVCADVHRFSKWCEQRDAEPAYDNFEWFLNAATDALLARRESGACRRSARAGRLLSRHHALHGPRHLPHPAPAQGGDPRRRSSSAIRPSSRP